MKQNIDRTLFNLISRKHTRLASDLEYVSDEPIISSFMGASVFMI